MSGGKSGRKRVLLTVNPQLIEGKRVQTVRSMAAALDENSELLVLPIDQYDMRRGKVMAYKRVTGGRFEPYKSISPEGDLWIVYTDGYWMDTVSMGYRRRMDFLEQQMDFHQSAVDCGRISRLVNSVAGERATLKDWLAGLNCAKLGIIPTFAAQTEDEVNDLLDEHGTIVAKPVWGGAGEGVRRISNKRQLYRFLSKLRGGMTGESLRDYCFQLYMPGDEKRLWFLGDTCVDGRIVIERATPWSRSTDVTHGRPYNRGASFQRDEKTARKVWGMTGLQIGSVDFLGDYINEINGCGTIFTYYNKNWQQVSDARPRLVEYLLQLLDEG